MRMWAGSRDTGRVPALLAERAVGARRVDRHGAAGGASTLGPMFISERRRRRRRPLVVAAVLLALAGAALAAFLILSNRTDDVHRGDEVEFRAPPPPPPKDDTVDWPVYHYEPRHTGYLPRATWRRRSRSAGCSPARC